MVSSDIATRPRPQAPPEEVRASPQLVPNFDTLYAEHFSFVWRNLRRLGVPDWQLDDAAQDVFVVVHRRLDTYQSATSARSWLFAILRRVASDYRRTIRRKGGLTALPEGLAASNAVSPAEGAFRRQVGEIISQFLAGLSGEQREVFVLSQLEQMTAAEVAEIVGLHQQAVYSRVRTLRKALSEFVAENFPDAMENLHG